MIEPLRDRERLVHMKTAIERILRYTSGKSYEDLVSDDMMYYAVVKNIEIIASPPQTERHFCGQPQKFFDSFG